MAVAGAWVTKTMSSVCLASPYTGSHTLEA